MKKQFNVQEQNSQQKELILSEALYWRTHTIPKPLLELFKEKGIDTATSILLEYHQDAFGIPTDEGTIVTTEGLFFYFEADLNTTRTALIEEYSFVDVSEKFELQQHKKGIGKTYGYLALEVLQELNSKKSN